MTRFRPGWLQRSFITLFFLLPVTLVAQEKIPVTVDTLPVQYKKHTQTIQTSGILSYKSQQTLSFKTTGPIETLAIEEGERVKEGQLLASLALEEIRAKVDEARARVELARKNLDRFSRLHDNNVISLDRLQSAETDLAVATSQHRVALFNLKYSSIKAPTTGLILRRFVEKNELVTAHQPILLVADTSQGWVIETGVTDRDIVRLTLGDKANIEFDAWPGQTFEGKVSQLATLADEKTGTFKIEVTLPDHNQQLRSGFVGNITIHPTRSETLTLIPVESIIQSTGDQAEVFVFDTQTNSVQQRAVSVDYLKPGYVASRSGLNEGELLVTTGAGLLRSGEKAYMEGTH